MKISGFSYIRNGFTFGYPFIQSIQSVLPICDEFVIAVGDSTDGTREALMKLAPQKLRIVDTVWDENLRKSGKIFAQQSNCALEQIRGDWALHVQADEVIHESELPVLKAAMEKYYNDAHVEGLLLPFLHFWGGYNYIRNTRRTHRYEIRAFKANPSIRPYKDSQGFRKFQSLAEWPGSQKGTKLCVKKVPVRIFHYNYVRNPNEMKKKADYFHRFWHDDRWLEENIEKIPRFNFGEIDMLEPFTGRHPSIMQEIVDAQDWEFDFTPDRSNFSLKDLVLYKFEKLTGYRLFEYRNYKLI